MKDKLELTRWRGRTSNSQSYCFLFYIICRCNFLLMKFQPLIAASTYLCTRYCAKHFIHTILIPYTDPLRKYYYFHFIDRETGNTERLNNLPQVAQLVSIRARILIGQCNSRPHALSHDAILPSWCFLPFQPELHIDWNIDLIDKTSLHSLSLETVFAITYTIKIWIPWYDVHASQFSITYLHHLLQLPKTACHCSNVIKTLSLHMLFSLFRMLFFLLLFRWTLSSYSSCKYSS